ncbi:hypothetical protein EL22_29020 [Halostagnicola sp. A56]|nr:hypothetical protein EL22_29020 [Halostagnicola sp. A56]
MPSFVLDLETLSENDSPELGEVVTDVQVQSGFIEELKRTFTDRLDSEDELTTNFELSRVYQQSWAEDGNEDIIKENVTSLSKQNKGETLGLVGESGCGKSTLGESLLKLLDITDGKVMFRGENVDDLSGSDLQEFRSNVQIVFQNPHSSLNPRKRIGNQLNRSLKLLADGDNDERSYRGVFESERDYTVTVKADEKSESISFLNSKTNSLSVNITGEGIRMETASD